MSGRLAGKVAIITGAGCVGPGWGNGRSECVRFAEEGAKIFAVDLKPEPMAETLERVHAVGGEIVTHLCDVTDRAQVEAMVEACIQRFGRVDILINNVGGSARGGPVEMDEETWDHQMDFNLKSVYLTCKAVLPKMEAQGSGAIINTGSSAGLRWTGVPQSAYAAAKAIRVNTVIPGQLHTPMVAARLAGQNAGGDVEGLLKKRQARIPLGFMGDGRDIANAALFLCSDEARFITGTELLVDGGMTARCD
jgi:NAD(P)-dependent dehydrogenase (short-subunit alcohol dehydrogenase family)